MSTTNYFPLNTDNSKEADDTTVDNFKNQCTNKDYIFNGSDNVDKSICDSIKAYSSSADVGESVNVKEQTITGTLCSGECVTNPLEVPEDYYGDDFYTSEYEFDYCGSDDPYDTRNYYYAKNPINCDACSYDDVKTTICDSDSDLSCTAADPMTDYKLDIYAAAKSYINFSKDIEIIKDEDTLNDNIIGINLRWDQSLEFTKCYNTNNNDSGNCDDITDPEVVHFYLTTKAINSIKIYAATIDANITFINLNSKAICATGNPTNLTSISILDTNIGTLKDRIAGGDASNPFSRFVLFKVTYKNSTFSLPFIWRKKEQDGPEKIIYPGDVEDNEFPLSVFNISSSTTNPFTGNVFKSGEQGYYLNINYPLTKIYKPILTKDTSTGKTKCTIPIRAPFSEKARYRLEKVSEDDYIEDDNVEDDYVEDDYIEDDNLEENISTTKNALIRYKDCCSRKKSQARCNYDGTCIIDEQPAEAISMLFGEDYGYGIKPYCTLNEATYQLKLNQFTLDYSNENCANFDICTFNSFK